MTVRANWSYPTRVWLGAGRLAELPAAAAELGMSRPLLVTDPGLARLPVTAAALDHCQKAGLTVTAFSAIKGNPSGANVEAGLDAYRSGGHDGIIAFGGGSALDAAKAVALSPTSRAGRCGISSTRATTGGAPIRPASCRPSPCRPPPAPAPRSAVPR